MKSIYTRIGIATAGLLLIPLVAMQFSDEVVWDLTDFIVAGVLLFSTGLVYAFLAGKSRNAAQRVAIGLIVFAALALVWAELAVGVFGTPWAGS